MADTSLLFNEHDIHLITKELQGSTNNTPMKTLRRDIQKELLDFKSPFNSLSINDILILNKNSYLQKSDILLIILILGTFNNLKAKSTSKYFWHIVLKCKIFRVTIFKNMLNSMSLCKIWRKFNRNKDLHKIFQLIYSNREEINTKNRLK